MARDTAALTVQGPDNGTGNPILFVFAPAGTQDVNLTQVAGGAVSVAVPGLMRIAIVDSFGDAINSFITGDTLGAVEVEQNGNLGTRVTPAANTDAVVTLAAVAGQRHRVASASFNFFGANAAVAFSISDSSGLLFNITVPAAQASIVHLEFPNGGLRGVAGSAVTITLPAGGAGVTGNLCVTSKVF